MSSKEEIFDYVMNTPENTNPSVLRDLLEDLSGGGDLPDPSALSDGTTMVAVNGEWKMQEGYGYTGDPAFEPIEWDGDTEGREHIDIDGIPVFFKISDEILTAAQFNGATLVVDRSGEEMSLVLLDEDIEDMRGCVGAAYALSGISGTYTSEIYGEFVIPHDGTYFYNTDEVVVTSLTAPPSVHQFDSALIPTSGVEEFVVTFTMSQSGVTADKTLSEISTALMNGMPIKGIYNNAVTYYGRNSNAFVFSEIVQSENMIYAQVIELSGENWTYGEFAYTLTPAT